MKIVVDENIPLVDAFFTNYGDVIKYPGRTMTADDLAKADALLVRSVTTVNQALLAQSNVKFVGTCTIGVDHLDIPYFEAADIRYSSAPGCNANSVVEYVYAALCALDVDWRGKRVGIIGCGNVGGLLYQRFKAQGVECLCYDPFLSLKQNPDLKTLAEVMGADIVCMHTPLTKTGPHPSLHLVGADELALLKSGAVLINAGRGPVLDNQALTEFLTHRKDVSVVLDVWEPEPNLSLDLLKLVNLGSPHIAGYSYDGKLKGTEMIYQAYCRAFDLPAVHHLAELVPPLADDLLHFPAGDTWVNLKALIEKVYSITRDDQALRTLARESAGNDALFAKGFDNLRKNYPVRREFHNYRVDTQEASAEAKQWLSVLGFQVI